MEKHVGDFDVRVVRVKQEGWFAGHQGQIVEPAEVQITVQAESASAALEQVEILLESICDDLAFRLQLSMPIRQLEVIDVSDPVAIGDERDYLFFPPPNRYSPPKFQSTGFLNDTITELEPELRVDYSTLNKRMQATMRWYHKALAAPSEVDKFIFLMICLEILCEDYNEKVTAPFKAKCGHEIPSCPTCDKSLERIVNGPTLKKFLAERLGMDEATTKETWEIRQMVHGANDLSTKKLSNVPRVGQALKVCIVRGISEKLERHPNLGPFISATAIGVLAQVSLMGRRHIRESDLDIP